MSSARLLEMPPKQPRRNSAQIRWNGARIRTRRQSLCHAQCAGSPSIRAYSIRVCTTATSTACYRAANVSSTTVAQVADTNTMRISMDRTTSRPPIKLDDACSSNSVTCISPVPRAMTSRHAMSVQCAPVVAATAPTHQPPCERLLQGHRRVARRRTRLPSQCAQLALPLSLTHRN